ncbi:DNA topoisomerase IV subunit B [Varunaivibrio sulfuroxidans]|uniref:DNA topoisomerase (ATP-hydrolyzing) n=2 Tax=Varunaivibrio sulfuroxidans TaxID=1773489 RepID=A0A4R3JGH6_9PROT|nr:DNA topoisomerase IV subunit B [Varunaivibrio sulfuroxidans]
MRPGMYVGGTDERALHHLVSEVLDNAMDEAVAGHASLIDLELAADQTVTVRDNGRGIPIDPHPKFKDKSALEVILTTLHSGGKFGGEAYETSGGLHGVGISVVNALSDRLSVEVARDRHLWGQDFSRGVPQTPLRDLGNIHNRRGTQVVFHPDAEIFGARAIFRPHLLYRLIRSKAYLFRGVKIRWKCAPELLASEEKIPAEDTLHFPGGLGDYLEETLKNRKTYTPIAFADESAFSDGAGKAEWAVAWPRDEEGYFNSYCNTVYTPLGGAHDAGMRNALTKGLRAYGELIGNKQAAKITSDDVVGGADILLSVFIRNPQFQGQTKEKLATGEATRLVEGTVRDHFDHWLSGDPAAARILLEAVIARAESRLRRKALRETKRQSATKKLRLPGKLADCAQKTAEGTEIFLVEGDSAGGSAKQARNRKTQAILPLRGKILNVASATADKLKANQELSDLTEALGCGTRSHYDHDALRYDKVIIMTDADVDGAHIASLLITFFYREMPELIEKGNLYLAQPPLYRLAQGAKVGYARDETHKDELLKSDFSGRGKVEISRFKGLGEMPPSQLKETTMDPTKRTLLRVIVPNVLREESVDDARDTENLVESLMGKKAELRYAFIQEHARFVEDIDV